MVTLRSILYCIKRVKITLIFCIAYIFTNAVYVILPHALELNYGVIFITSPFNFLETFLHIYASPFQGLVENFGLVLLFIMLAECYSRFARVRVRSVSIDDAFFLALGATYATSALWWMTEGVPVSGTSVVAFSIVLYLLIISLADIPMYAVRRRRSAAEEGRFLLWIFALVVSAVASLLFLDNPSYMIHLVGIAFFGVFLMTLMLYRLKRNHQIHPLRLDVQ